MLHFLSELTMRSLINAAFSLERFEFYAGIHSEEELGAFAIEMDVLPILREWLLIMPEKFHRRHVLHLPEIGRASCRERVSSPV